MAMIRPETEMKDSGVQWIGDIPSDWNIKPLYACLDEINQKNNPVVTTNILSLTNTDGVIPYSERGNQGNKSKENFEEYKVVYPNTIVANSMNILIGSVGLSKYEGCVSPVYYVYMAKPQVDIRYMNYLFQMEPFQKRLRQFANGILEIRLRVSSHDILHQKVAVPDYDEQQVIADYLDETCSKIDEIIAEAKASIDEYKELKQSVIFEAVTKGLDKNVEIKECSVNWLDEIPSTWESIRLKYLLTEINNRSETGTEQPLSVSQVMGVVPSYMISVANPTASYVGQKIVEPNDIVFNKLKAHLGVFFMSKYHGLVSPDYAVYRTNDKVIPKYLEYLFHTSACISEFKKYISGVAEGLMRLYTSDLFNIRICLPKVDEQIEIVKYLDKRITEIDSLIAEKESLIKDLEAYKKSLIYEVVTGKRRVV